MLRKALTRDAEIRLDWARVLEVLPERLENP